MTAAAPSSILAVRLQGLGDVLMTTPALRAARRAWPDARLTMLVGRQAAPAVASNPHLDEVVTVDERLFFGRRLLGLLGLARRLRRRRFDLALAFSRSPALRVWLALAGVRRVRVLPPRTDEPAPAIWEAAPYEAEENLALLDSAARGHGTAMDFVIPAAAHARAEALLAPLGGRPVLVLAPGGGENAAWRIPQKRWPAARFAELADAAREGWGMAAVVVGGASDGARVREMAARARHPVLDATAESLEVAAGLVARAALLATNDSVAMHLGLILGTPFVALFGPTNPRAVLPREGRYRVVRAGVACSPCFWQARPRLAPSAGRGAFTGCPHPRSSCLEEIAVADVLRAAESLLEDAPLPGAPGLRPLEPTAAPAVTSPALSVVLPMKDEADNVEEAVRSAARAAAALVPSFEIVAVDDGSEDGTAERLRTLREELGDILRVVRHDRNLGYGAALRSGFQASRGELVFYTDSDNQFDLGELRDVLPLMRDQDVVLGYRLRRREGWTRRLSSRIFNGLSQSVLGVTARDVNCSFKLFRGDMLRSLELTSDGFLIDVEIVARLQRKGWRAIQHGVRHFPRRAGRSTVRFSDVPRTLWSTARLWRRLRREERPWR